MSTLSEKIPFEIHLTTEQLPAAREGAFVRHCEAAGAKALLIELSRGMHMQQPMLSTVVYSDDLRLILSKATTLSQALVKEKFGATRLKIETPAVHAHLFAESESDFDRYFEWHGKIGYDQTEILAAICQKHKVHLSVNVLKSSPTLRFITLREYGTQERFEERIRQLVEALNTSNIPIHKQEAEYCIYDNNSFLDEGWLPQ